METTLTSTDCCVNPVTPMPLTEERHGEMVAVFKALADASRLDIFRLIAAQSEPICVCEIVDRFDLTQPTISHHLKVLREAGLVHASRRGTWAYYAADPHGLDALDSIITSLKPQELALT